MNKNEVLNKYIIEFLHVEEESTNRMMDLYGTGKSSNLTIELGDTMPDQTRLYCRIARIIKERIGRPAGIALRDSSPQKGVGNFDEINILDWTISKYENADLDTKVKLLTKMANSSLAELKQKGVNSLFLSVGAIKWDVPDPDDNTRFVSITTPLLIFPIKLVRSGNAMPYCIEFVADDIRLNPCLIEKIARVYSRETADKLPLPVATEGAVNIAELDVEQYFASINTFIGESFRDARREFALQSNKIAISNFNSIDIAMYYDLINHKKELESSRMIEKLFTSVDRVDNEIIEKPLITLPADTVQEGILARAVNNDDLIIKGPPGTGKTLTIANLVASLMGAGKKVMFVSAKTSALAEVCNKLPEHLRPFVLELFCESETEAASFNVNDLIASLRKARDAEPVKDIGLLKQEIQGYQNSKKDAVRYLDAYKRFYFTDPNPFTGRAFYSTINNALVYNGNPRLREAFIGRTSRITVEDYNKMHGKVELCEANLNNITNNGEKIATLSPWYDAEIAVSPTAIEGEINDIKETLRDISEKITAFMKELGIEDKRDEISLALFSRIVEADISKDNIQRIIEGSIRPSVMQALKEKTRELVTNDLLNECFNYVVKNKITIKTDDEQGLSGLLDELGQASSNKSAKELLEIKSAIEKMNLAVSDSCDVVLDVFESYSKKDEELDEAQRALDLLVPVVGKQREARYELLNTHSQTLSKYSKKDMKKFSLFEGKAKKAYEEISRLPIGKVPTINEVTKACEIFDGFKVIEAEKKQIFTRFVEMFGDEVTEKDVASVEEFISGCESREEKKKLLRSLLEESRLVEETLGLVTSPLERVSEELKCKTADELADVVLGAIERAKIEKLYETACKELGLVGMDELVSLETPETIICIKELSEYIVLNDTRATAIFEFIKQRDDVGKGLIKLERMAMKYGLNPIYRSISKLTLVDIDRFVEDIGDARISNACLQLKATMDEDNIGCLRSFLEFFALGIVKLPRRDEINMTQLFEYAYFNACTIDGENKLTKERASVFDGTALRAMEKNYIASNTMLARAQARYIAHQLCVSNKHDPKYAFLNNERPVRTNARVFFKENAKAILSLARCVVLSPYSVSVFMKPKEYFDYDVLIVDEASQLPARVILPCAIRAKQVVLVGDQNQMPPILYFVRKDNASADEDDEEECNNIQQVDSILDLAIKNKSIDAVGLVCHYRSNNESLIAYSQKRYYDDMTTFPTANPEKDGKGLVDVFVDGGHAGGVNMVEANKVVELIEKHFDEYYDEDAKMLRESLGVVVFGQKQLACIDKLLDKSPVRSKINLARANTKENPDKTYFITAVDGVQGQEIEHLIISLTYCKRDAHGVVKQSFGMLNRVGNGERLGERIFNVAVTRAIKSLSFVHSVHSYEITKPSLSHLREYLEMLEALGNKNEDTAPKFVSNMDKVDQFALSVQAEISKLISDKERIVYGYGVTEKSLRIPIAILSKDKTHASLAIFCETDITDGDRYVDSWVNYPETMEGRGWKLHRMYIHDWYFNHEAELKALKNAISSVSEE
ncbi:MAG: DUF4011 domain-containing protein [Clostridia bacterium]|nr:DUF4011 domain-containing protein [Clostridia bacterium]